MKMTELRAYRSFTLSPVCSALSGNLEKLSVLGELEMTWLRDYCTACSPIPWLTSHPSPHRPTESRLEGSPACHPGARRRWSVFMLLVFKSERPLSFFSSRRWNQSLQQGLILSVQHAAFRRGRHSYLQKSRKVHTDGVTGGRGGGRHVVVRRKMPLGCCNFSTVMTRYPE